jgi:hypothetical protein
MGKREKAQAQAQLRNLETRRREEERKSERKEESSQADAI